jgi:hypothetical protein
MNFRENQYNPIYYDDEILDDLMKCVNALFNFIIL